MAYLETITILRKGGGPLSSLNHIIKQPSNINEHYLILGASIKEDKLFKSENLVSFVFQTSIKTFFGGQRFESKKFVHICVQTYMTTFFSYRLSF